MATYNIAPLTGGTSKLLSFDLPAYAYALNQEVYLYYKITGSSGNNKIVTMGVYIDVTEYEYTGYNGTEPELPAETKLYTFGESYLTGNGKSIFYCPSTTNFQGSLLSYEYLGTAEELDGTANATYPFKYLVTYRYWLGNFYNGIDLGRTEYVLSSTETTQFNLSWQASAPYLSTIRDSDTIYISFNNAPYINSYPTAITDTMSGLPIEYYVPDPSILDYISFGILDSSSNLLVGYKMAPGADTSYNLIISDQDREALYARYSTVNTASVQFGVRYKNLNGDPILVTYPMSLEIVIQEPTIEYTALDTDAAAIAATGNNQTLIRYQSDIKITINPVAHKGASITRYVIQKLDESYGYEGQPTVSWSNVVSNRFSLYAKDSRGNETRTVFSLPLVEYFPVTANLAAEPPNTDGELRISLSGKYWNGNFGAMNNYLKFQYKYTSNIAENNIDWTDFNPASINVNQGNYTANYTIMVPNHADTYTVQVRAYDEFGVVVTNTVTVKAYPVFDWSQNDFNFNVPVSIQGDLTVSGKINNIEDHVVSQGTSGIWTYRLWDSGVAECWGTVAAAAHSITNSWGSIYTKDNAIARQSYPFQFIADPVVSMTLHNPTGNCWAFTGTPGGVSKSPAFGLARGASGSVTVGARIMAIGRWK